MGIDIVEGRNFRESDGDVYILNESAKKQYDWLRVNEPITDGDFPVIGFFKDIKYSTLRVDDSELPIAFFVPKPGGEYAQWSWQNNVLVRVSKGVDKRQIKQKVLDVVNRIEKEYTLDLSELNYIDSEEAPAIHCRRRRNYPVAGMDYLRQPRFYYACR